MHENDTGRGRPARPFAPRLVRAEDQGTDRPPPGHTAGRQADAALGLHDPAVREVADSLADLFLGSQPPSHAARREAGNDPTVSLSPHEAARNEPASPHETGCRRPGSTPMRSIAPSVEMVILGHLPVLAGAWLTQYASQAAQSLGRPVGLVRLEPGGLSIDLFGVPRDVVVDRRSSLADALQAAGSLVGGWLLRVDELAEAGLAESPRIGALTLLSGVSESSIVAAYRTLKAIVQRSGAPKAADGPALAHAEPGDEPAELRIALLGATAERAREASIRVRRAAATFLGRPVGIIVCAERIGLTSMRSLYRGAFEGDAATLLELLAAAGQSIPDSGNVRPARRTTTHQEQPAAQTEVKAAPRPAPRLLATTEFEAEIPTASSGPSGPALPEPTPAANVSDSPLEQLLRDEEWLLEPEADQHAAPSPAQPPRQLDPAPLPRPSPPVGESSANAPARTAPHAHPHPVAISHAALLGLSPLPIRSPDAARVEFAVDSSGGLHAIVLDEMSVDQRAPHGSIGQVGRAGVAALLAADAWARSNMDLLTRAMPFVKAGELGLHLLTRVPAAARDLLGTRVRVHLLAKASGPGDLCIGLN